MKTRGQFYAIERQPIKTPAELLPEIHEYTWTGTFFAPKNTLPALDLKTDDRFLDVGCGLGEHVVYAARWGVKGEKGVKEAYGVDSARNLIKYARILAMDAATNPGLKAALDSQTAQTPGETLLDYLKTCEPDRNQGGTRNAMFAVMNPPYLAIRSDSIDKTQCLSVASYMESRLRRRTMMAELLRVTVEGGMVHISSFGYSDGEQTVKGVGGQDIMVDKEFEGVADTLNVKLRRIAPTPTNQFGGVYLIERKPTGMVREVFRR